LLSVFFILAMRGAAASAPLLERVADAADMEMDDHPAAGGGPRTLGASRKSRTDVLHDDALEVSQRRSEKLLQLQKDRAAEELAGCTFKPDVVRSRRSLKQSEAKPLVSGYDQYTKRLQLARQSKAEALELKASRGRFERPYQRTEPSTRRSVVSRRSSRDASQLYADGPLVETFKVSTADGNGLVDSGFERSRSQSVPANHMRLADLVPKQFEEVIATNGSDNISVGPMEPRPLASLHDGNATTLLLDTQVYIMGLREAGGDSACQPPVPLVVREGQRMAEVAAGFALQHGLRQACMSRLAERLEHRLREFQSRPRSFVRVDLTVDWPPV